MTIKTNTKGSHTEKYTGSSLKSFIELQVDYTHNQKNTWNIRNSSCTEQKIRKN
mgnify:CR=1 FL=1